MEDNKFSPQEHHEAMAEILRNMLSTATESIKSIDLEQALDNHNKMEELKKIIGVK